MCVACEESDGYAEGFAVSEEVEGGVEWECLRRLCHAAATGKSNGILRVAWPGILEIDNAILTASEQAR